GGARRRVHLPTYPFERQRHWAEQAALPSGRPETAAGERRLELAEWFWLPTWRQTAPRTLAEAPPAARSPWLLLLDERGVAERVGARLAELGAAVVTASAGAAFARRGPRAFTMDPGRRQDYDLLLAALAAEGLLPRTIVHAWSLGGEPLATTAAAAAGWRVRCFDSLVLLAQALATGDETAPVRVAVVTDGVLAPDGPATAPLKATLLGPCRVLPREQANVTCQVVDVDVHRLDADRLVAELAAEAAEREVAHRGVRRWVAGFEPVRLGDGSRRAPLRERGVYLLTGGLGGIGGVLAEHLAASARARLVLVGRSASPRAELVRRLETLGAEVLVVAADVADPEAMGAALAAAEARFGALHGVVHAAGVPGGGVLQLEDLSAAAAVMRPKVTGTAVLWSLLAGRELDFVVLCSSIISALGTYGQADYCAANAFLDAFAASAEGPVVSVAWDGWEEVGMAAARPAGRDSGGEPVGHPLVHRRLGEGLFASELGPASSWVLDDHRLLGQAVLPGTAYLEMARAAWCAANGAEAPVELRDVVFLRPLSVADGASAHVRLTLGGGSFGVRSDAGEHATGAAVAGPPGPAPVHDLAALLARCRPRPRGGPSTPGLVAAGPHWHVIREIRDGDGEAVARIELAEEVAGDLGAFWLHPSLLDGATAFGLVGTERQGRYLPLGYGALVARAPLPRCFWSHVRWLPGESVTCDVTLVDDAGRELVRVERFLLREVDAAQVHSAVRPAADTAAIRPREGVEALLRVLGERPGPCVVVSARALPSRLARAAAGPAGPAGAASPPAGERSVATRYVAPETEVEESVAALWSQVLGIERIGVDDDFFELGGNSLVAIQLVGRIRDGFQIEFGIQQVLERPTVRRLAEVVEERLVRRLESMTDEEVRALLEER
ncbi:MAG TPA: SDR family NAD(P)-dependent oxidoreductase, partial [Candidatus Eisenbacteria bacterium]|nr:SDR family NAD(P)-dependent oxidoreductase [Candidatus Eisenbacteria bacterium]